MVFGAWRVVRPNTKPRLLELMLTLPTFRTLHVGADVGADDEIEISWYSAADAREFLAAIPPEERVALQVPLEAREVHGSEAGAQLLGTVAIAVKDIATLGMGKVWLGWSAAGRTPFAGALNLASCLRSPKF